MAAAAPKSKLTPEQERALVELMTTAILEVIAATGQCEPHDLEAKSFSKEEIDRNWVIAKASADFELRISRR